MISKSDFASWLLDDVTKAFHQACRERIEETKELLSVSAGLDDKSDNYIRGFLAAYNEIKNFRVEDEDDNSESL